MTAIGSLADSMSRLLICLDVILVKAIRAADSESELFECDKEVKQTHSIPCSHEGSADQPGETR